MTDMHRLRASSIQLYYQCFNCRMRPRMHRTIGEQWPKKAWTRTIKVFTSSYRGRALIF